MPMHHPQTVGPTRVLWRTVVATAALAVCCVMIGCSSYDPSAPPRTDSRIITSRSNGVMVIEVQTPRGKVLCITNGSGSGSCDWDHTF